MMEAKWTATSIAANVGSGALSAYEVIAQTLDRIARLNPKLNAFTDVTGERALAEAIAVDRAVARGQPAGPLAGVPFAVKNLFDVAGLPTLAGSKINRDNAPAAQDATLIRRLNDAGAILVGGLNMGEYAYDFTGENSHYGASRNPHNVKHMSGGSSGGSGTAVAAGMVPIALGSDTNGSIRVPSSLCGTFGLKPTFGRLPRTGTFPFCASLDHLGPMALSVTDLALAYDAMLGSDPNDPACAAHVPGERVTDQLKRATEGLRIAVAGGYFRDKSSARARDAVERVARALGVEDEVELPEARRARAAAYILTNAESSNLHLPNLRARAADYDPDVRDRLIAGALMPATWYIQAQRFRAWYREQVAEVFKHVDVIIAPATPMQAPLIGQRHMTLDGERMLVRPHLGMYTQPISFIGLPVVVVPVCLDGELPIGVQLIAAPWRESYVLRVAAFLESEGFKAAPAAIAPEEV